MADNSTPPTHNGASDNSANIAESLPNMSRDLYATLTADSNSLFTVMQDGQGEILLAALRNPAINENHICALLKRRQLGDIPMSIYSVKRLIDLYPVKYALASHPETPSHVVLALLPQLYIFDLLKLCTMPGITPDQRLAAERAIIQRLPTQPLGNKLTLARRGTAAIVETLLKEGIPNLLEACLDNPHLKEGSLYQFLSSSQATAENISIIGRSNRWKGRPNIRLAILKNPRTPAIWYTLFLPGLPPSARRDLLASPRLTPAQKKLVKEGGKP